MRVLVIALLLILTTPAQARDDLPWPLPDLPVLRSPTPIMDPGPTLTLTPDDSGHVVTSTPAGGDFAALLDEHLSTLEANLNATPGPLDDDQTFEDLGTGSSTFLSFLRAVFLMNFGVLNPLFLTLATWFSLILAVKVYALLLPMTAIVFGVLRKIWELVLQVIRLIPGVG